jgi:RNA polymerase sigma-70 factor (ECF subfamily)
MLQAIDQLPEDEREVFELVRIQGLTQVEAAEAGGLYQDSPAALERGARAASDGTERSAPQAG